MKKILLLLACVCFLVFGCTSTNDAFLIKALDDQGKAQALTNQGIQEYDLHLVHRQDLDLIPRIRQYFSVALAFDPNNTQAQQYLTLIDNYKNQKRQSNLNSAAKILAKARRTDDDNYALFVSLQTAARVDPADATVKKMLGETSQDRARLVDTYLTRSKAALAGVNDTTPDTAREKAYIDAFSFAKKAQDVEPKSGAAQNQVTAVKADLTKTVASRAAVIQKLIADSKFVDARAHVAALNDLNRHTGNNWDGDVRLASYRLN